MSTSKQILKKLLFNFKVLITSLLPINLPRLKRIYILDIVSSHIINYPTPAILTYFWGLGSLAGACLVFQMLTGIFLSTFYTPTIELAFVSIQYIMRDAAHGWLIRYMHANGASMFFIVVYLHMCRGLYYGSYMKPRESLWCSGVILFFFMMGTAFTGYVLPWGQISFWGATVITNMVTIIPIAGKHIVQWFWGGYVISKPTIVRFYNVHFLLPFAIAGLTLIHLALLHKVGSANPVAFEPHVDDVAFSFHFIVKDVFVLAFFLIFFATFVSFFPNTLCHPDNYIPANPIKTPRHVVPEWYFLPFYAILRSIPHKTGGILAMLGAILVLLMIPFTYISKIRNTSYRPIFKLCFWAFIVDFVVLNWVGHQPITDFFIFFGQVITVYYYVFFLILLPLVGQVEFAIANHTNKVDVLVFVGSWLKRLYDNTIPFYIHSPYPGFYYTRKKKLCYY